MTGSEGCTLPCSREAFPNKGNPQKSDANPCPPVSAAHTPAPHDICSITTLEGKEGSVRQCKQYKSLNALSREANYSSCIQA